MGLFIRQQKRCVNHINDLGDRTKGGGIGDWGLGTGIMLECVTPIYDQCCGEIPNP